MMTKTAAVARMVVVASGRGHAIFNDRLVDGTRSLKVWGWREQEYTEAKKLLELYGCQVQLVTRSVYESMSGRQVIRRRLHVTE